MSKTIILAVITLGLSSNVMYAQHATIKGIVTDAHKAIEGSTLSLLKASDSTWIQSVITDNSGAYQIKDVDNGSYIIDVQAFSYKHKMQAVTVANGADVKLDIALQLQSKELKEVAITANKPFIEMGFGKTILNVGSSIATSGSNVLELLKKSPGITVDMNGNISMQGKAGVTVLIDDKPTYLSGRDLADYLKTLSSDEVAQLELITQPSAKYDAEGDAGIINIKTKKVKNAGLNGMASTTYSQGVHAHHDDNVQLDYKKNRATLFLNVRDLQATGFESANSTAQFKDPVTGDITSTRGQHTLLQETFTNYGAKAGVDYNVTDRTTIGASADGNYHPNNEHDHSEAVLQSGSGAINNYSLTQNSFLRKNLTANAYIKHTIDSNSEISADADMLHYSELTYNGLQSYNYDAATQQPKDQLLLRSTLPTVINVYSLKSDYTTQLPRQIKLEAGVKSSLVTTTDAPQYDIYNQVWMPDTTRSSHFEYRENINAAYVSANKDINKKWKAQAGLRAEQWNTYGNELTANEKFERHELALFPTAYIGYTLNDKNQFEINYGRRIERPDYKWLDPFKYYTSQYSYRTGNPYLKPLYTNNIELKHIYNHILSTSISYSHNKNELSNVTQATNGNVTADNLINTGTSNSLVVSVSLNKQLYKWLGITVVATSYYNNYNGYIDTQNIQTGGMGYGLFANAQINLQKGWTGEMMLSYNGQSVQSIAVIAAPSFYQSIGFSKKLFNDTATIKVNVTDPFYAYKMINYDTTNTLNQTENMRWDTQQASITFAYNFGRKKDKITHIERTLPEEDERAN